MIRAGRWLALALATVVLSAACTNPDRPSVQGETVPLPTPLRSFDASVSATIGLLQGAVGGIGSRLDFTQRPYRPSEPQSLLQAPRVVMRAQLADPDDGYVLIYDFVDAATARLRGQELADYLGSGFGQTNYPVDAQFSVGTVNDTVVFTWWSRRRSAEPERAAAVFDAMAAVGERIDVLK